MEHYSVEKLRDNFYRISENYSEDSGLQIWLILGTEKAVLVDSGMGMFGTELKEIVEGLTKLPVLNILTHGHPDHIAGSVLFDDVYMNSRDEGHIPRLVKEMRMRDVKMFSHDDPDVYAYADEHCLDCSGFQYKNIDEEDTIDIGGNVLEILKLPGHSLGSIAIYNEKDGYVLSGDAFSSRMAASAFERIDMFADMAEAVEAFVRRIPESVIVYGGHRKDPIDRKLIMDTMCAAREIAEGKVSGDEDIYMPMSPVKNQKKHVHGDMWISYNPKILEAV